MLRADGRRVPRSFRPAYGWLSGQMRQRVAGMREDHRWGSGIRRSRTFRQYGQLALGKPGVRIELELPRERVLLPDSETWHCVLNRWHLSRSWRESKDWDRKVKGLDQGR